MSVLETSPFRFNSTPGAFAVQNTLCRALEHLSGLAELDRIYRANTWPSEPRAFCEQALRLLRVDYSCNPAEIEHIPRSGGAIVVANHPFGGLDGIIAAHLLTGVRSDVRIMVNHHLCRINELRELFIPVDPYASDRARHTNSKPLREALRWVRAGGLLLIFPAGDVARYSVRQRGVREVAWQTMLGRLVRHTQVPVIPLHVYGHNSWLFQSLGVLHAHVRTLLLPRELLNKTGRTVSLRIGRPIKYARLQRLDSDEKVTRYLKLHNWLLGRQPAATAAPAARNCTDGVAVINATPVNLLQAEIDNLSADQCLLEQGDMQVFIARAGQMPWLLQEIGRLREITFRAVGEGTGRTIDLDDYDTRYQHLFIWQRKKREIVGAYRLACVDEIITRHGIKGLYTHSLFRYGHKLLARIDPSIELGRSFVRPEYQRHPAALLLLWRGICNYLVRNPHYRYLFGPVTISGNYDKNSLRLLVDSLKINNGNHGLRVRPRKPIPHQHQKFLATDDLHCVSDIDLVSDLIAQIESDHKGVPVLIRQYLKMGAKFLAFNVDADFNNAVDGLIVVDMKQADPRLLQQYMGKTGAASYLHNTPPITTQYEKAG